MEKTILSKLIITILKGCALGNPTAALNQFVTDGIDIIAEKVIAQIPINYTIKEILSDKELERLNIPSEKHEVVRSAVEIILNGTDLDLYGVEPEQIAIHLYETYCKKYRNQYDDIEGRYIKYGLSKAIKTIELRLMEDKEFWLNHLYEVKKTFDLHEKRLCNIEGLVESIERSIPLDNQAQVYRNNWKKELFLNRANGRVAGVHLSDDGIYQLPHFYRGIEKSRCTNLDGFLSEYLSGRNGRVKSQMLVVLGQPGSGKSTLISYLLNNLTGINNREILVYPFAMIKLNGWHENARIIPSLLVEAIGLREKKEFTNKILILDGFDEVIVNNNRRDILDQLYDQWCGEGQIPNFTLIVTCRENALPNSPRCPCIRLCPLDEQQIISFAEAFWEKTERPENADNVLKKLTSGKPGISDIMGIPLLLYMTLAIKVDVNNSATVMDVYDRIFSLDTHGIYHRCEYDVAHAVTSREDCKKQLHSFSKRIAIKMWEDSPEEATIFRQDFEEIANEIIKDSATNTSAALIEQFFWVRHSEGEQGAYIRFVHRSIYEYFVAQSIFDMLKRPIIEGRCLMFVEAQSLVELLGKQVLTKDIEAYLNEKIQRLIQVKYVRVEQCVDQWREWFGEHLLKGMRFEIDTSAVMGLQWLSQELKCFLNLVPLMRLIISVGKSDIPIFLWNTSQQKEMFTMYTRYILANQQGLGVWQINFYGLCLGDIKLKGVNLRNINFENAVLTDVDFSEECLSDLNLCGSNLTRAKLSCTNFVNANLRNANLLLAELPGANFSGADLEGACMICANLAGALLKGANLKNAVFQKAVLDEAIYTEEDAAKAILLDGSLKPLAPLSAEQNKILVKFGLLR